MVIDEATYKGGLPISLSPRAFHLEKAKHLVRLARLQCTLPQKAGCLLLAQKEQAIAACCR